MSLRKYFDFDHKKFAKLYMNGGFTLRKFQALSGASIGAIMNALGGRTQTELKTATKLAKGLNVPLDQLQRVSIPKENRT